MSHEELPQQEIDTSDDQHNSSDGANASRKGQPWTEEEHLAFLEGLRKFGKGNWRMISKTCVPSRTPTQVASHAQKHFMRVAGATKRKSRFTALEVEVLASCKSGQQSEALPASHASPAKQQPAPALQPSGFPPASFPAMPFPFMHPMMFGFPGPFLPPFLVPSPAFAAAAMTAMQKQGQVPMMMPPMFPVAMSPFFLAQQMTAAVQAANAAALAQAVASGGGATVGTGVTATTDTATSGEMPPPPQSSPGSPGLCKPEAQHARRATPAAAGDTGADGRSSATTSDGSAECDGAGGSRAGASSREGPSCSGGGSGGVGLRDHTALVPVPAPRSDEGGPLGFHSSTNSAFRPPQEIKAES